MSPLELIGVVLALLYVVLAMKEHIFAWYAAIASSLCYIVIFFEAALYTESALQLFFIALSIQGLRRWGRKAQDLPIRRAHTSEHLIGLTICTIASLLLGSFILSLSGAKYAYVDASITVASVFATYLTTEKILENWIYWVGIDIVATVLYVVKGLWITSGLYGLYVVLALIGYFEWKKSLLEGRRDQLPSLS